jgi:hypothetical protein
MTRRKIPTELRQPARLNPANAEARLRKLRLEIEGWIIEIDDTIARSRAMRELKEASQ